MILQPLASGAVDSHTIETGVLAAMILASKVWDRTIGQRKDRERGKDRDDLARRLDEHALSDATSFGKIDTSLARLDATLNNGIREDVGEIKQRFDRMEERLNQMPPRKR